MTAQDAHNKSSAVTSALRSLVKIADDLEKATAALTTAGGKANEARRVETDCRNRVNTLQKEMDAAVGALRARAPTQTDWHDLVLAARSSAGGTGSCHD